MRRCFLLQYQLIQLINYYQITVMIRRRSTLDMAERQKRTKIVQVFSILDLCLQLPSNDKLIIRQQVKEDDQQLIQRIYQCKRDKNYHNLQIYLRKKVQKIKENDKWNIGVKNYSRGKASSNMKSTKNPTQSSYHNSFHNSINSESSAKKVSKSSNERSDMQKHIQNQINRQIKQGILKQQCQIQRRDITPRQIEIQVKPLQIQNCRFSINIGKVGEFNMKAILKAKINEKSHMHHRQNIMQKYSNYLNNNRETKQLGDPKVKTQLTLSKNNQNCMNNKEIGQTGQQFNQLKYGEFYKRIKKVIQQAH